MRVGILGGGQLARMMVLAGTPLGLEFSVLDPAEDACAGVLAKQIHAAYDDAEALDRLADNCDLVTFEFENVPATVASRLAEHAPVFPPPRALAVAQNRLHEKRLFDELGIPVAPYRAVDSLEGLQQAVAEIGLPAVLKSRTQGYDGKGQRVLRHANDLATAWQALAVPCTLEALIPFEREVSQIAVRDRHGEVRYYPLCENSHRDGILLATRARPDDPLQEAARSHTRKLLESLHYVGVLALEFFVRDGQLLANEFAPRVHNTGHWTIEGAVSSQFENHLRAVTGMPLGVTDARSPAAMVNLIGKLPARDALLALPGVHPHFYGKQPKPGRKIGHVGIQARDPATLEKRLERVSAIIEGPRP
jgi:5-(carboxyamino)imidazole ribonucleotide synthase